MLSHEILGVSRLRPRLNLEIKKLERLLSAPVEKSSNSAGLMSSRRRDF
jgi:hypothetical protein